MEKRFSQFRLLNQVFDRIDKELHALGNVVWEIDPNPEESHFTISNDDDAVSAQLERVLADMYVPAFCYSKITHPSFKLYVDLNDEQVCFVSNEFEDLPNSPILESTNFHFEGRAIHKDSTCVEYIQNQFNIGNIKLITIYQKDGFRKLGPEPQSTKSIGTLLFYHTYHGASGDVIISQENRLHAIPFDYKEKSFCHWVAFLSECKYEIPPITRGVLVVVTYDIESLGHEPPIAQSNQDAVDKVISCIAECDTESIGLLLDRQYTDEPGIELHGQDLAITVKLKQHGFAVETQNVLFYSSVQNPREPEVTKCVYSFSESDFEAILKRYRAGNLRPKHEEKEVNWIPFYRVGKLGTPLRTVKISDHDPDYDIYQQTSLYWCTALVAHKPTWWTFCRLLWIGKLKNSPHECLIASLPLDVIKEISLNVIHGVKNHKKIEAKNEKKRKRD